MKGVILAHHADDPLGALAGGNPPALLPFAGQPLIAYAFQKLLLAGVGDVAVVAGADGAQLKSELSYIPAGLKFFAADAADPGAVCGQLAEFAGGEDCAVLDYRRLFQEPLGFAEATWLAARDNAQPCLASIDPRSGQPYSLLCAPAFWRSAPASALLAAADIAAAGIPNLAAPGNGSGTGLRELGGLCCELRDKASLIGALAWVMSEFGAFQVRGNSAGSELFGPVGIVRGASAINCRLFGPVLIGNDCVIEDSSLGPNVAVERGCRLSGCTLMSCQVMPGTVLSGVSADEAVLAPEQS